MPNRVEPQPMQPGRVVRVLIADDHALLRRGVADIINQEADMDVVAQAGTGEAAVRLYLELKPDVALIDLSMPEMDGVEAIRRIRSAHPDARLIILTTYDTDDDIECGLRAGAQAYLLKDVAAADLIGAIRDVLKGKTRFAPSVAAKLAERVMRVQLTARELGILKLIAVGRANKEIADSLNISDGTVKVHITHLFEKLSVTSRTEAIAEGMRRGLIRVP